jgi:hypothetical protein
VRWLARLAVEGREVRLSDLQLACGCREFPFSVFLGFGASILCVHRLPKKDGLLRRERGSRSIVDGPTSNVDAAQ